MATQAEIGTYIGLSDRSVRQLMKEGIIPNKSGRSGYDLQACVLAYVQHLRAQGQRENSGFVPADPDDISGINSTYQDARLVKLRADHLEEKLKIMRKQNVPVEAIEYVLSRVAAELRGLLDPLPGQVKKQMPALSAQAVDELKKAVTKAGNVCSRVTVHLDEFLINHGADDSDTESD